MRSPERAEIDHHTLKLIVGLVALTLGNVTSFLANKTITSISESYWVGGWAQSIFIGFLFAIGAFLLAYNGESAREMISSKVAAVAAFAIALFPCRCGDHPVQLPHVHNISAVLLFAILAYFCHLFRLRAAAKQHSHARWRARIYQICGAAIVLSIVPIALEGIFGGILTDRVPRLVFYGERTALVAFGISWLTASRVLPVLTHPDERISLLPRVSAHGIAVPSDRSPE